MVRFQCYGLLPTKEKGHDMPSYLTSTEFEDLCNLPKGAAAQLRYRGGGPAFVRMGGRIRYRREDIEAWIDANTHLTTAQAAA